MKQPFVSQETDNPISLTPTESAQVSIPKSQPTYSPTRWSFINSLLARIDELTHGKAGLLQRLFTYLLVGGLGAVVNLLVFSLILHEVSLPLDERLHNIIASTFSFETALICNFLLNDYFTFRHLEGHKRSWRMRCLRFHLTGVVGYLLTLIFQFAFTFYAHFTPFYAQALAILLVLVYNFTFHHIYTYRRLKPQTAKHRAVTAVRIQSPTAEALKIDDDSLKLVAVGNTTTEI